MRMAQRNAYTSRGFTLVELMAVVTIVGILATMALVLLNRHVRASRTAEALSMVQSIRAAQESFRAENRRYLSVSKDLTDYYPARPDGKLRSFYRGGSESTDQLWNILRPTVTGPVRFGYAVVAGNPGDKIAVPTITDKPQFPDPAPAPYYVIQATGDLDNDGAFTIVAATSFSSDTYVENDGE
jgi:prepilin-type N-terminal cleavage/methylation domain-containing protein